MRVEVRGLQKNSKRAEWLPAHSAYRETSREGALVTDATCQNTVHSRMPPQKESELNENTCNPAVK